MKAQFFKLRFLIILSAMPQILQAQRIRPLFTFNQMPKSSAVQRYVVLADGTKIFADDVQIGSGSKLLIVADGVKYKLSEVKLVELGLVNGSRFNHMLYTMINNDLFRTYVSGDKISVFDFTERQRLEYGYTGIGTIFCLKKGDPKFYRLKTIDDVIEVLSDCKSFKKGRMLDEDEIKEEIKTSGTYLNQIIDEYNQTCN